VTGPQVTPGFGPDGHVALDSLAELDESLLDAQQTHHLDLHLQSCPECRDRQGRLRTTRALLSALPPEAMPADVVRRIDAALTEAATTATVVPITPRRRWLTSPAFAGIAAAVAAIGLVSGLVISRSTGGSSGGGDKATTSALSPHNAAGAQAPKATVKQWATGANYTAANIAALVPGIVVGTPTPLPAPTPVGGGAAPNNFSGAKSSAGANSYTQEQLRSPDSLTACAAILNAGTPVQPLAADYAEYNGKPATIIVFPSHDNPSQLDVWVVRSVCSGSSVDLVFYRVARPS
jgi:hypothetical protein